MILKLTQRQKNALNRQWKHMSFGQGVVCEPRIVGGHSGYLRVMFLRSREAEMVRDVIAKIKQARKEVAK